MASFSSEYAGAIDNRQYHFRGHMAMQGDGCEADRNRAGVAAVAGCSAEML